MSSGDRLTAAKMRAKRLKEKQRAQEKAKLESQNAKKNARIKALREKARGPTRLKQRDIGVAPKSDKPISGARRSSKAISRRRSSRLSEKQIQEIMKGIEWDEKDSAGFNVPEVIELMLTLDEDWETRVDYIKKIGDLLLDEDITDQQFLGRWRLFRRPLGEQLADPRSSVVGEACSVLTDVVKSNGRLLTPYSSYLLEKVFPLLAVRIKVMREAAEKLGESVANCIPDDPAEKPLLTQVLAGIDSGHGNVRTQCILYLKLLFVRMDPIPEKEDTRDLLDKLQDACKKAVNDASPQGRVMGYKALNEFKRINPPRAQAIIDTFSTVVMQKFKAVG